MVLGRKAKPERDRTPGRAVAAHPPLLATVNATANHAPHSRVGEMIRHKHARRLLPFAQLDRAAFVCPSFIGVAIDISAL
jgi:hypothetical protein